MSIPSRDDALALLHEYVQSESLRKHMYCVEIAMDWYARHFEVSEEEAHLWRLSGLLHDFDYERWPDADGHPMQGNAILKELGYPESVCTAIMGHALYTGVPRESLMAKTLFAVDELCGLCVAAALVRPDKNFAEMKVKSLKKKFKDKAFARGCNRDDISLGAEELGIERETHFAHVLSALQESGISPVST